MNQPAATATPAKRKLGKQERKFNNRNFLATQVNNHKWTGHFADKPADVFNARTLTKLYNLADANAIPIVDTAAPAAPVTESTTPNESAAA